ncbi:uncharacterized protein LOC121015430 isoform X2 [Herpailurus yagouaroundi]|uniref:uncharacterized protein LOC121015430 isoform X2 n=1 Tax=Herpailurus yagouaroundi TaxID=1608482 RepID=UPI001AD701A4|nr:uncharacterized protein LOC121015430 isoform X2 [Puma yagouaroundi]
MSWEPPASSGDRTGYVPSLLGRVGCGPTPLYLMGGAPGPFPPTPRAPQPCPDSCWASGSVALWCLPTASCPFPFLAPTSVAPSLLCGDLACTAEHRVPPLWGEGGRDGCEAARLLCSSEAAGPKLQEAEGRGLLWARLLPPGSGHGQGLLHLRQGVPAGTLASIAASTTGGRAVSLTPSPLQLQPPWGWLLHQSAPHPSVQASRGQSVASDSHRKLLAARFEGPLLLPGSVRSFLYTDLEPAALYQIKLQAFKDLGDG